MTPVSLTALPHSTGGVAEAPLPRASADRAGEGGFSFADVPRLTAALRAADEAAFRWLYAQWNGRLFRYCFVLSRGDEAAASEIAQAVYLRVARPMRVLPDESALWNWLARAARNAGIDLHRQGGRYQGALERFARWLQGALQPPEETPPAVFARRGEPAPWVWLGIDSSPGGPSTFRHRLWPATVMRDAGVAAFAR